MTSNALFAKQVETHSQTLSGLLMASSGVVVPTTTSDHVLVTTKMLAGSASLMELPEWEQLLRSFEALLSRYSTNGYAWDERIASVTSEIIEKEETFATALLADSGVAPAEFVDAVELNALVNEIAVLEEECESGLWPENIPVEASTSSDTEETTPTQMSDVEDGTKEPDSPMAGMLEELENVSRELRARMDAYPDKGHDDADEYFGGIRDSIGRTRFCLDALDGFVRRAHPDGDISHWCDIATLQVSMTDFAAELSAGSGRELNVTVECEEILRADNSTLAAADAILRAMVHDIFRNRDAKSIEILARVIDRFGTMHWTVMDNAGNLVSDSHLDHEDQLAFYPSLKNVIHTIGESHGLLWVEREKGREARFEFRLPVASRPVALRVWGSGKDAFAVRSSQVCEFRAGGRGAANSDSQGEFVVHDGHRVPLVKLDTLYSQTCADGAMIAVVGSVEKRIAFYVPDEGVPVDGTIVVWNGQPTATIARDGSRATLVDANDAVARYLMATGTLTSGDVSGGATEHDTDYFQSQAASRADVSAPPDHSSPRVLQVLVVDESDSMRDEFADILAGGGVQAVYADCVDEALDLLDSQEPALIISEFRMPTMAAKRLMEALNERGKSIPVLVTTSQSGQTAELLVDKLGVSGYLRKPLVAEEVSKQIDAYIGPRVGS